MNYLVSLGPNKIFKKALKKYCRNSVLMLGIAGDAGLVSMYTGDIVGINIAIKDIEKARLITHKSISLVLGDAEMLPFIKCQFDTVVCKSTLHHLNLLKAISETYRILKFNGLLILYEPGLINPIAMFGRLFFKSSSHVDTERPFIWKNLLMHLNRFSSIQLDERFLIFSHIFPILAKYIKFLRNKVLLNFIYTIDHIFCKTKLKELAWIGVICVKK